MNITFDIKYILLAFLLEIVVEGGWKWKHSSKAQVPQNHIRLQHLTECTYLYIHSITAIVYRKTTSQSIDKDSQSCRNDTWLLKLQKRIMEENFSQPCFSYLFVHSGRRGTAGLQVPEGVWRQRWAGSCADWGTWTCIWRCSFSPERPPAPESSCARDSPPAPRTAAAERPGRLTSRRGGKRQGGEEKRGGISSSVLLSRLFTDRNENIGAARGAERLYPPRGHSHHQFSSSLFLSPSSLSTALFFPPFVYPSSVRLRTGSYQVARPPPHHYRHHKKKRKMMNIESCNWPGW